NSSVDDVAAACRSYCEVTRQSETRQRRLFASCLTSRKGPVGCENLVTLPGSTRGRHRPGDLAARYERRPVTTLLPRQRAVSPVAPATALDVAGARCNGRRTRQGSARGAVGSESATSRDIPCGRCARIARRRRWLGARETAYERSQSPRF